MSAPEVRYRRRPGIAWREEAGAVREAESALGEGQDAEGDGVMLLVDRGRVFELNILGAEIWKRCDGTRGAAGIATELAERFDAPEEVLRRDVQDFLEDLEARRWVERA